MKLEVLNDLSLNPLLYRHEDFNFHFRDLTHREKLQNKEYRSINVLGEDAVFNLDEYESGDKKLVIIFDNKDSYFLEKCVNKLHSVLGTDIFEEEEFNLMDYDTVVATKSNEIAPVRTWLFSEFEFNINCTPNFSKIFLDVRTKQNKTQ